MADFRGGYKHRFHLLALLARMKHVRLSDVQVLIAIMERYNTRDGYCFPSIATLAQDAKVSRRQVIRAIERMEGADVLTVTREGRSSNLYAPNWELVEED